MIPTTSKGTMEKDKEDLDDELLWKWEVRYGRGFVVRNESFQMPMDNNEYYRWDIQHDALRDAVGLCYESFIGNELETVLSRKDGRAPRVLDVGTGSGKWAVEIATNFPFTEVRGIDFQKPPPVRPVPVNCKFEQDDVNFGLDHYANEFDVVHARVVDLGIKNYASFLYEVGHILRAEGIVLLFKPAMCLFQCHFRQENGEEVYEPLPECGRYDTPAPGYHLQKLMCVVRDAVKRRGGSEDAWMFYREMLQTNPNFDPQSIKIRWLNVPVCPFPPRIPDHHRKICQLMEENMKRLCESWTPMLLQDGYDPEELLYLKKMVWRELDSRQTRAYSRWTFAFARRNSGPWVSPPSSRSPTNSDKSGDKELPME